MEIRHLIICDIDDSLIRSNTTFDFLAYIAKSSRGKQWRLGLLTHPASPLFLVLTALGRITGQDLIRNAALRILNGLENNYVEKMAFTFYENGLKEKINPEVWNRMNKYQDALRCLASSTLQPVAHAIASSLGVAYRASELEEINGRLTGRLAVDLTGQKERVAIELKREHPVAKLVVITDNRSDRNLVAMADERIVVIRRESDKSFWSDLQPSYIHS